MNDAVCEVTSQSESNWRTHRHPTSQGDRYPIGEVKAGFGIEALIAGSGIGEGASEEASEDAKALSGGDLRCGTTIVCAPSYVGECLWISPSAFHMHAY